MSDAIRTSYARCRRTARRARSSFLLALLLLPPEKRRAMYALYSFLRRADDLADADQPVAARRRGIQCWRASLENALAGTCDDPLLPALVDTVRRYEIPPRYLFDVIDGVEMDLRQSRYETFDDLAEYCHRVASAVGLACVHIWGFSGDGIQEPARQYGLAFQLTNILRDLKEDARRGRVYLPLEDLRRFGYTARELLAGEVNEPLVRLMRFEIERAEGFYRRATPLADHLSPEGRRTLKAMVATYRGLLDRIKRRNGDVFTRPVRLGKWQKLWIAARSLMSR